MKTTQELKELLYKNKTPLTSSMTTETFRPAWYATSTLPKRP